MDRDQLMTIGRLSHRTSVPIKALREYTDLGLVYTVGRSDAGYRLYTADALWCVRLIVELRGLGLTIAEIRELCQIYAKLDGEPIGPFAAGMLRAAKARVDARIDALLETRRRIERFEIEHRVALTGIGGPDLWDDVRPVAGRVGHGKVCDVCA